MNLCNSPPFLVAPATVSNKRTRCVMDGRVNGWMDLSMGRLKRVGSTQTRASLHLARPRDPRPARVDPDSSQAGDAPGLVRQRPL